MAETEGYNNQNMQIIDGHCHIGPGHITTVEPDELIRVMDSNEIAKAIVCPMDEYLAVRNKQGNDNTLRAVKRYPGRLMGLGAVNPWYGREAIGEVNRVLDEGLIGIKFHPRYQGFMLNDDLVYPLLEVAAKRSALVYFHTGTPICAMPFQLAELAGHFPSVSFIMGHMGSPDFWYDTLPAAEQAENIYLETSHASEALIKSVQQQLGVRRVIFGSDYPFSSVRLELAKLSSLEVAEHSIKQMLGENILDLLAGGKK